MAAAPILAPPCPANWVSSLDRLALEGLIEIAIAEADARDGDPDREPGFDCCEASDDHLGGVHPRWRGHRLISPDDDFGLCIEYGVDQSRPTRLVIRY
jgi:hypothetical protein